MGRIGNGVPQRGVPGVILCLAAHLAARLRGGRRARRQLHLERDVSGLHEPEALTRLRSDISWIAQLAFALLQVRDLAPQRGLGRGQLRHLGALRKVRPDRTGDGQRQHTHHGSQDRGSPRRETEPLIRPLLDRFGERPLDRFDDMFLQ